MSSPKRGDIPIQLDNGMKKILGNDLSITSHIKNLLLFGDNKVLKVEFKGQQCLIKDPIMPIR